METLASPLSANPGSADARPVRTAPASVPSAARTETASPAVDLTPVRPLLEQVWAIEQDLNTIIVGRQEPIHLALLALLAEQHLFLLGPFGTAKSQLITELAARVGSPAGGGGVGGLRTFIKLCAPGTKPEELFGPPSIASMKQDVYRYATTNMLPEAELALLDEFFNAGEFLHGPVLSMMAERAFDNPTRTPVPLITLFSASNRVPRPESVISRAAWDRFPLRVIVEYVSDADFLRLLDLTPPPPARPMITKTELQQVQRAVAAIPIPQATKEAMLTLRRELRGKGVSISDRRWMQSRAILRAHALLEGRDAVEEDDLMVFQYMWEEPEQLAEIRGICARLANPLNAKAIEFGDQAHSVYQAAKQAIQRNADSDAQSNAAFDAVKKLKAIATRLHALRETALNEGRNPARIEHVLRQVEGYRDEMAEQALGKIAPRQ